MKESCALGHGSWIEAMQSMGTEALVRDTTQKATFPPTTNRNSSRGTSRNSPRETRTCRPPCHSSSKATTPPVSCTRVLIPVLGLYPSGGPITSDAQVEMLKDGLANFEIHHLATEYHMVKLLNPEEYNRFRDAFCSQHGM